MIYYVEDDDSIRELVVYTLSQMGMETKGFAAPAEFWSQMETALPDLVLLDVMLPDEDGLHILSRLHDNESTTDIPVIMITAKGTEFDKVKGLDLGADDYIAKPFGMAELIARVRARLRRVSPKEQTDTLTIGKLSVDKRAHIIYLDKEPLSLTLKEYDLLCLLMENPGRAFTREHLLEAVWDIAYGGGTRTVDVHIQTLRSKLGDWSYLIETVRGVGYRFGGK